MSNYVFSERSLKNMAGVHPDLVAVIARGLSLSGVDFMVTEGLRTKKRQRQLVAQGASQTMNSRHITGHAVDVMAILNGKGRWDWPLYEKIAGAVKKAALELEIPITWGGDWQSLRDGPHFELDRRVYPS
jgi:peptidoglycan L-alanyl-D-glutamate endopeptidase CwlK